MVFGTCHRGEIYYIEPAVVTGSEMRGGRPAIVVSNNHGNNHSKVVEVVYLTTSPKSELPTHVQIKSAPQLSTALCEQISTVSYERVGRLAGVCTRAEMSAVDKAMMVSLGVEAGDQDEENGALGEKVADRIAYIGNNIENSFEKTTKAELTKRVPTSVYTEDLKDKLRTESAKLNMLREMYSELMHSYMLAVQNGASGGGKQ